MPSSEIWRGALWQLSQLCRKPLLEGRIEPVLETLVWTVKSWWGVQGVARTDRTPIAEALVGLEWSVEDFEPRRCPRWRRPNTQYIE